MNIAKRVQNISPSMTLVIADKARKMKIDGIDVISFATGEPDFPTPEVIKEEGIKWIHKDFTKYVASNGISELKEAICRKFEKENGLVYTPDQILVGNGAKQLIFQACGALLDPGDEVIIPTPCWVSYIEQVKLFGGVPVLVDTNEADNFQVSAAVIEKAVTNKTKMIIINSPNNPSGALIPAEELKRIAKIAVENEIFVISDEVYEKLVYIDAANPSIGALGEDIKALTITINSLSKSYCMTGWRVGYSGASHVITKAMAAIHGHVTGNVNSMSQKAATLALNEFHNFAPIQEAYTNRRAYIVDRLNDMNGIHCNAPDGAFYVYPNVHGLIGKRFGNRVIKSSFDVAELLIDQAHIACVPGEAFGMEGYVRFTFAIAPERIEEGMDRMDSMLNKLT